VGTENVKCKCPRVFVTVHTEASRIAEQPPLANLAHSRDHQTYGIAPKAEARPHGCGNNDEKQSLVAPMTRRHRSLNSATRSQSARGTEFATAAQASNATLYLITLAAKRARTARTVRPERPFDWHPLTPHHFPTFFTISTKYLEALKPGMTRLIMTTSACPFPIWQNCWGK
jgi:hypothetical protein